MPAVLPSPAMGEGSFPVSLWRIKSACPQCGGATRSDGTDTWCGCGCEWTERRPELPASFKGLVTDDDATAHKFSSTQFDLATAGYTRTDGSPIEAIAALQSAIAPEDLAEDGKELRFHITVKYGLHTQAPADVQAVVQQWVGSQPSTSIEAFLGAATLFAADEATMQRGGATSDVLKLDVQSEGLASLNRLLSEKLEHTDTYPTYFPHLTIAYLKPGLGQKYVGLGLRGWRVLLNKLTFSDRDGRETIIDLWGRPTDAETLRVDGVIEGNANLGSKVMSASNLNAGGALVGAKPPHPLKRKRGQSLFFDPEGIKQLRGKYKRIDKGLLGNSVESAGRWLARKWEELEGKHGRVGALNMAINFLLSSPMPGNLPRIVSIAHAVRGISELAVGKQIKSSPFAARYKAMCEQGQTSKETDCTPVSGEAASSKENPEEENKKGRLKEVGQALMGLHPSPGSNPGHPENQFFKTTDSFEDRERIRQSPAFKAAEKKYEEHTQAEWCAFVAEGINHWLNEEPAKLVRLPKEEAEPKERVARAKKAVSIVGEIGGYAEALWSFKGAIKAVSESHEGGPEALEAARKEAKQQFKAAVASAEEHIAGLPAEVQVKARKKLKSEMENFDPQEETVAPVVPPSPFKSLSGWHMKDWVTMGGKPMMHGGRQEQHHGGTPVELDESGTIRKGPGPLVGKKPGELRRKPDVTPPPVKPSPFKAKKPEPPPVAPKPEPKPEPPPPPAEPKRPAKHQKVSNPKELVDLLASHEVADRIVKQAEELTKGITELEKQVEEANKKSYQTFNQKYEAIKQGKKPGDPEYDKVAQEYERQTNEVGSMRAELTAKQQERANKLMEALKIAPEERVKVKIVEAGVVKSRNVKNAAWHAAEWLNQYVAGGIVAPKADYLPARVGEIPKNKEQRAYYSHAQSQVMLTNGNGARTAVHEIGHHIETTNKAIHEAAHVFLAHRLKGEKPQQLNKVLGKRYDDDEYGRKDDFDKAFGDSGWYVGKHYDHGATEVISMGLEMMHSDPVKLATKDPEYFKFMVAVMDGTIR